MEQNQVIQRIKELGEKILPEGVSLWLFGSRARGSARQDSDWDLLILIDEDRITLEDYGKYAYPFQELGWNIDSMVSPIMYTKKDWERSSFTPFYKNVMQDRIVL